MEELKLNYYFKEMEKYLDIKDEQKLRVFGIFAKDDETGDPAQAVSPVFFRTFSAGKTKTQYIYHNIYEGYR